MNTFKLKTAFVFAIATLFSFAVSAQDYTFKVTSLKGNAKANGTQIFVGSKIKKGSIIEVTDGTMLNIAHKNGKALSLTKSGTYKVDDLAKGCATKSGSLSEKYAAFVLNELTAGKSDGIGANNMSKTGSVDRGLKDPLDFNAIKKTNVIESQVTLSWYPNEESSTPIPDDATVDSYKFVIKDLLDNVIYETAVTKPSITLNLEDDMFKQAMGNHYMYKVVANVDGKEYASAEYMLEKTDKQRAVKIKNDISTLGSENTAINKLILAKYFEDHGLYANAMYAYEEAIKLSDSDEMYENMYQAFLDRNYLSKKAKQMGSKKKAEEKKENK